MERYRIHEGASVYFVTCSVVEWLPVFIDEAACLIVADSLAYCQAHKGLRVNAYVIMPTHMHAILFDHEHDSGRLAETITAFRKHTGRALSDYAADHLPRSFTHAFRDAAASDRARQFWQPSRHPVALTSRLLWQQKLDYLHDNPRRKGLVLLPEHWRFSSARYYIEGKSEQADMEITEIAW